MQVCGGYPSVLAVPATVSDHYLATAAHCRAGGRLPVLCYRHEVSSRQLLAPPPACLPAFLMLVWVLGSSLPPSGRAVDAVPVLGASTATAPAAATTAAQPAPPHQQQQEASGGVLGGAGGGRRAAAGPYPCRIHHQCQQQQQWRRRRGPVVVVVLVWWCCWWGPGGGERAAVCPR